MLRSITIALGLTATAIPAMAENPAATSPAALLRQACIDTRAEPGAVAELAAAQGWAPVPVSAPGGEASSDAIGYATADAQVMLSAPVVENGAIAVCTVVFHSDPGQDWQEEFGSLAHGLGFMGPIRLPSAEAQAAAWTGPAGESLSYTVGPERRLILLTFSGAIGR